MEIWFIRILGGLTFYFVFGFLVLGLWFGPALLGYKGAFAADMAVSALPVFVVLWVLCLPFFVLISASIEVLLELLGFSKAKIDLR